LDASERVRPVSESVFVVLMEMVLSSRVARASSPTSADTPFERPA
jgi:hypothetical protein